MTDKDFSFKNLTKEEFVELVFSLDLDVINKAFKEFDSGFKGKSPITHFWNGFRKGAPLPKTKVTIDLGELYDNDFLPLELFLLDLVVDKEAGIDLAKEEAETILANVKDLKVSMLLHKLFKVEKSFNMSEMNDNLTKLATKKDEEIEKIKEDYAKDKEKLVEEYESSIQDLNDKINNLTVEVNAINTKYTSLSNDYDILKKEKNKLEEKIKTEEEESVLKAESNYDTLNVLKDFNRFLSEEGLSFKKEDVYNFHFSLITRKITILSGRPGIGKSKLALEYAKFFKLREEDKTMLFLPISPSYTEPSDILGFFNPRTNMYMPSETNLVDFLIHAESHEDQIHLLIFDEMNLAQIEYYFAPFISNLERGEKTITLYADDIDCLNKDKYKSKIKIKDNLLICGTINTDETTQALSERLTDRVILVKLEEIDFLKHHNNLLIYKGIKTHFNYDINKFIPALPKTSLSDVLTNKELTMLDNLNKLFKEGQVNFNVSYRNLANIELLIYFMKGSIKHDEAFDIALKETMFTKINGPSLILGDIISKTITLLENNKDISSFINSLDLLNNKQKELDKYGYIR